MNGMIDPAGLFSVAGRTALVTGGATGIGRICAEALLAAGARVLIASRKEAACLKAAEEMSALGPCEGLHGDVASQEGVDALTAEVTRRAERLDILVNNAGTTWGAPYESFGWAAWDKVMSVNVTGLFSLTRNLTPLLAASAAEGAPSRVVNVGSLAGTLPVGAGAYSYAVSKAGVHHLTKILANELAHRNITVNAIAPGPFRTRMTEFALGSEAGTAATASRVPLGRVGAPADVAAAILYLCGPGGGFVTGAILPLDGGLAVETRQGLLGGHD